MSPNQVGSSALSLLALSPITHVARALDFAIAERTAAVAIEAVVDAGAAGGAIVAGGFSHGANERVHVGNRCRRRWVVGQLLRAVRAAPTALANAVTG